MPFASSARRKGLIRWVGILSVTMLLCGIGRRRAVSQSVIQDCESCLMQAEVVVELGSDAGQAVVGSPAWVVQRYNGQWVLTDYQGKGRLLVFSRNGTFLKAIGGSGQGPGEYDLPERLRVMRGDSLEVVDFGNLRITTLDPSLEVSHTRPVGPPGHGIAFLRDGRHVIAGTVSTSMSIGLPIHVVNRSGKIVRSFGAEPPIEAIGNAYRMWRSVAPAGDGAVWSAHLLRYVIERWDTAGRLTDRLERDVSWFAPQSDYGFHPDASREPTPGMPFIYSDRSGLLWTTIDVPDRAWESAFTRGNDLYGRPADVVDDFNNYWDSVVEVIDPVKNRVVGHARLDARVLGFAGDGLVFTRELRGEGYPVAVVYELQPPRSRPD